MTNLPTVTAIEALHGLLTNGAHVRTEEDDDGRVDIVNVELPDPLTVAELEAAFGPASKLPHTPAGDRSVVFRQTQPGEGESRWSVYGRLDRWAETDIVTEVRLRFDEL